MLLLITAIVDYMYIIRLFTTTIHTYSVFPKSSFVSLFSYAGQVKLLILSLSHTPPFVAGDSFTSTLD